MLIENVDVLVIGAGPSGSVAASYLHKMGISVKVVEKTKFPRIVVGESLIPRVMDHFAEADLFPSLDSMGFQKKPGARFIRGKEICIFDFSDKFSEGWDWTWQIPRADFDLAIANEMIKKGVDLEFESEVTHIEFKGTDSITTVIDKNKQEKQINAKFLIDASGYGRVLPRLLKLDAASKLSPHSAIFSHIRDVRRPEGVEGTQISFDILETKVWLWVIPFSNGNTSVGIVGPTDFIESLSNNNSTKEALEKAITLSDFYIKRFGDLPFEFDPIKLANYSISVQKMFDDGYVLTGNSTEFLDPVFSSGVCFATESGMLAAKLAIRQIKGEKVDWQAEYSDHMNKGIDVFTTYIQEWYTGNLQELFFHQPENSDVKRKICSVLAGYVWDDQNPFVKKHNSVIRNMAHLIKMEKESKNV
ncbi:tryptophan 7-halogenase [Myroides odoratimimus]|uniref:NAD(P)/FAD-dependent oxidoreductase n=1 Tax=Myroides odoratimimus TaxID=76832 RepID=UPI0025750CD8|nr:NAD(P)/FAD-dependent oxidoreductase [Myroides odoratimimus]MDM1509351.1 tryptophan 7-halogenase [Myroides odoratimimus]MDM1525938.1 tryptophan 7-halogenase [Myroides odoratimimus]MDM1679218.1 tryptophan 7-halogenase [Myroides odoratimimus]MEC4034912.1 NAD(P)/FAD-dependent oxidoreductase [Myroides odoratimimus]MEC4093693.1 NAD(P)/FAD-dependent oxidoreductase [Myroides odoratimimus]